MEAPPLERKLVAILAADVEGYSRLMGIDEEGTLFEDLGEQSVKNIAQPIRVFRLLPDAPMPEAPSSDTEPVDESVDAASLAAAPTEPPASDPQSVKLVFWDSIKDSTRAADYEAHLEQYPEGEFKALAEIRPSEFGAPASA
jgi:hypothetical protein